MSEVAEILTWVTNTINLKTKQKNPSTTLNILPETFAVQYLIHNVLLKTKTKQEHTIISWSSLGLPLLRTARTLTEGAACCDIIEPEGALQGTGGCSTFFNLKIKTNIFFFTIEFHPLITLPVTRKTAQTFCPTKFLSSKIVKLKRKPTFSPLRCRSKNGIQWCQFWGDN